VFQSFSRCRPLCDGKGLGGTFHTLGVAWWGVDEQSAPGWQSRSPPPDPPWSGRGLRIKAGGNPYFIQSCTISHNSFFSASSSTKYSLSKNTPPPRPTHRLPVLELPVSPPRCPFLNPGALCGEIFRLISSAQSSGEAVRIFFQPSSSTQPVGSDCEAIRRRGTPAGRLCYMSVIRALLLAAGVEIHRCPSVGYLQEELRALTPELGLELNTRRV